MPPIPQLKQRRLRSIPQLSRSLKPRLLSSSILAKPILHRHGLSPRCPNPNPSRQLIPKPLQPPLMNAMLEKQPSHGAYKARAKRNSHTSTDRGGFWIAACAPLTPSRV